MNKQSNTYTIIYIICLIVVVGTALAGTSLALRQRQQDNADADKMRQILAAVHISPEADAIRAEFDRYITGQLVINELGDSVSDSAFDVNMSVQAKTPAAERELPVFVCTLADGARKYIIPLYGAGLWGPIWGYIALDADGSRVYGAYFAHQGETPGLGAEIEKPAFSGQFNQSLSLWHGDQFLPVAVVKKGQKPAGDEDYVDGISGGTITSKGVSEMLSNCLTPYKEFLKKLSDK